MPTKEMSGNQFVDVAPGGEAGRGAVFGESTSTTWSIRPGRAGMLFRWCVADDWKLFESADGQTRELYNVSADPHEKKTSPSRNRHWLRSWRPNQSGVVNPSGKGGCRIRLPAACSFRRTAPAPESAALAGRFRAARPASCASRRGRCDRVRQPNACSAREPENQSRRRSCPDSAPGECQGADETFFMIGQLCQRRQGGPGSRTRGDRRALFGGAIMTIRPNRLGWIVPRPSGR